MSTESKLLERSDLQEHALTVLPSMGMPGGTKGTEPVAMMMLRAVTLPPTSTRPGPCTSYFSIKSIGTLVSSLCRGLAVPTIVTQ